jgi:hypothetical protein
MATPAQSDLVAQLRAKGLRFSAEEFLHQAATGHVENVLLFLSAGMPAETKNELSESAILLAAKNGHVDVVLELHKAGASLEPLVHIAFPQVLQRSGWEAVLSRCHRSLP